MIALDLLLSNVSIVENAKYLGVIVDKFLSWDKQISAVMKKVSRGLAQPFLTLELGGKCPPIPQLCPPSHSVFDPIKLSLFWNSCQCNDKVGYYPWNLCERIKFWKRILRNRVLITKIMSILRDPRPAIGRYFQKKDRRDSRPTLETYQNREFVAKFFWDCFIVTDYPKTS